MHNGLTHWSQVMTSWELVGLGLFGVGVQLSNAAGSQGISFSRSPERLQLDPQMAD